MSDIVKVLKAEIVRLAKKEAKSLVMPLKADVVKLKKSNVALRKFIKQLQADNEFLMGAEKRRQLETPAVVPETTGKARVTAKGVRALRKKLGLSQAEFARLINVSMQSVASWESKSGKLNVRDAAKANILSLRGVSRKEAEKKLELLPVKKVVKVVKTPVKKAAKVKSVKKVVKKVVKKAGRGKGKK